MSISAPIQDVDVRQCPYCGKQIRKHLINCPICREAIPEIRLSKSVHKAGGSQIRQGLLGMLLAVFIYYLASGASGWQIPITIHPAVNTYLTPLLFLTCLGMTAYGFFLRMKA